MKRCFILTAVIPAIIFIIMYFCAPNLEESVGANIAKYVFG